MRIVPPINGAAGLKPTNPPTQSQNETSNKPLPSPPMANNRPSSTNSLNTQENQPKPNQRIVSMPPRNASDIQLNAGPPKR